MKDWRGKDPWRLRTAANGATFWENTKTGEIEVPKRFQIASEKVEYQSPVDGKPILSKSMEREEMKRNDCVHWEPGLGTKGKTFRFPEKTK